MFVGGRDRGVVFVAVGNHEHAPLLCPLSFSLLDTAVVTSRYEVACAIVNKEGGREGGRGWGGERVGGGGGGQPDDCASESGAFLILFWPRCLMAEPYTRRTCRSHTLHAPTGLSR